MTILTRDPGHKCLLRADEHRERLSVVGFVGFGDSIARVDDDVDDVWAGAYPIPGDADRGTAAAAGQINHLIAADLLAALRRVALVEADDGRAGSGGQIAAVGDVGREFDR